MSVMIAVRTAISESHQQIEMTPFSKGMMDGSISRSDYANGLVQLWYIHGELERLVQEDDSVATYFTSEMIRTRTISRDLEALGFDIDRFNTMPETIAITNQFCNWAVQKPFALLGCIYILEGSRMGSLVIAKPLSKTLGLKAGDNSGIEYHTEGAMQTPSRMRAFKEKIDQAGLDSDRVENLMEGAVRFMELLNTLYAALLPECTVNAPQKLKSA
jgi:heme oxygenase (biliverdin-producing, ferredoxin)